MGRLFSTSFVSSLGARCFSLLKLALLKNGFFFPLLALNNSFLGPLLTSALHDPLARGKGPSLSEAFLEQGPLLGGGGGDGGGRFLIQIYNLFFIYLATVKAYNRRYFTLGLAPFLLVLGVINYHLEDLQASQRRKHMIGDVPISSSLTSEGRHGSGWGIV